MKKINFKTILLICLSLLIVFLLIFTLIRKNNDDSKKVNRDLDASDSQHYSVEENIRVNNLTFTISNFTLTDSLLTIETDLSDSELQEIADNYTFSVGSNNQLFPLSSQINENKDVDIQFDESYNSSEINQIMIIDNRTLTILATIELYN